MNDELISAIDLEIAMSGSEVNIAEVPLDELISVIDDQPVEKNS